MKLIDQSYEILNISENILETIEKCARTCYKSEDKIGCKQDKCTTNKWKHYGIYSNCATAECEEHSAYKLIKSLIKNKHHAMIEFGDITVKFITNRSVTHELVRHRLCSFAQQSQRYVKYDGDMEFIKPVWYEHNDDEPNKIFRLSCERSEFAYKGLIDHGWRAEQAREVLPNCIATEIVVKANLREWTHIFQLRCSKKAHPQIRSLMINLLKDLKVLIPLIFEEIKV